MTSWAIACDSLVGHPTGYRLSDIGYRGWEVRWKNNLTKTIETIYHEKNITTNLGFVWHGDFCC
jgi:hypothetical protein